MAIHLQEININTFRGIKNLKLNNLSDVNIILGGNNSGKTSLLEVINTLNGVDNLYSWMSKSRQLPSMYDEFDFIFDKTDNANQVVNYSALVDDKKVDVTVNSDIEEYEMSQKDIDKIRWAHRRITRTNEDDEIEETDTQTIHTQKMILNFDVNDDSQQFNTTKEIWNFGNIVQRIGSINVVNTVYVSPTQHSESVVFLTDILDNKELYVEMINLLKKFDDKIISINADTTSNSFSRRSNYKILSENYSTAMPLSTYGDGMKKAVLLISAVVKAKNGILLIDEFETALHTGVMKDIFKWIVESCKKLNVQLFLTTHNIEAVEKILECSNSDDTKVITLKKKTNETVARILNAKDALMLKDEMGMELR